MWQELVHQLIDVKEAVKNKPKKKKNKLIQSVEQFFLSLRETHTFKIAWNGLPVVPWHHMLYIYQQIGK